MFSWIIYYYPYIEYDLFFSNDKNSCHLILFNFIYSGWDWAQREAFLEIDRREKLGLPYIDPNLVDPAKITLPSEEELKKLDFDIHL